MRPRALVLQAHGTNRERDAAFALTLAGADAEVVPLAALLDGAVRVAAFQLLVVPGGFSYGDALGAGRLLGLDLGTRLRDDVTAFIDDGWPVLGICNGFQALVRAGLLPGLPGVTATLTANRSGRFECRWTWLLPTSSRCVWTRGLPGVVACPTAHGEGAWASPAADLDQLVREDLVALRYARPDGSPAGERYPDNPSGSQGDVAGVCNPGGNVLGLMPHPENHVVSWQHPSWTRGDAGGLGLALLQQGVRFASQR